MNKDRNVTFRVGDDIAYATHSGMLYGTVTKILGSGDETAVEIEFEDGRKEIKKGRDRALSLLRRGRGAGQHDEQAGRQRLRDPDVERIRRAEQRKRS